MGAQPCPNCPATGDHHCPATGAYVTWVSYPFWAAQRDQSPPAATPLIHTPDTIWRAASEPGAPRAELTFEAVQEGLRKALAGWPGVNYLRLP